MRIIAYSSLGWGPLCHGSRHVMVVEGSRNHCRHSIWDLMPLYTLGLQGYKVLPTLGPTEEYINKSSFGLFRATAYGILKAGGCKWGR